MKKEYFKSIIFPILATVSSSHTKSATHVVCIAVYIWLLSGKQKHIKSFWIHIFYVCKCMYLSFISFYLLLLLLLFASHLTKKKADSCGLFFFAIVLNRSNGLKCSFYYFSTRRHWKKYLVALSRFTEAFFIRKYIVGNINLVYSIGISFTRKMFAK